MDTEKQKAIREKEQQINILRCDLTSAVSEVGDYKITKTYEARLLGEVDPYDTKQLIADRQAKRDEINKLQAEIEELRKDEAES